MKRTLTVLSMLACATLLSTAFAQSVVLVKNSVWAGIPGTEYTQPQLIVNKTAVAPLQAKTMFKTYPSATPVQFVGVQYGYNQNVAVCALTNSKADPLVISVGSVGERQGDYLFCYQQQWYN